MQISVSAPCKTESHICFQQMENQSFTQADSNYIYIYIYSYVAVCVQTFQQRVKNTTLLFYRVKDILSMSKVKEVDKFDLA